MDVVLTVDGGFTAGLTALIKSLLLSTRDPSNLQVVVVQDAVKVSALHWVENICRRFGATVDIVPMQCGLTENLPARRPWNHIVYQRLFVDRYLPSELHQVLYLDCDVVVVQDLAALWARNYLNLVSGVPDYSTPTRLSYFGRRLCAELQTRPLQAFINCGVMMLDVSRLRGLDIQRLLASHLELLEGSGLGNDQSFVNSAAEISVGTIPDKWNRYAAWWDRHMYDEHLHSPSIVHFAGPGKPWEEHDPTRASHMLFESIEDWDGRRRDARIASAIFAHDGRAGAGASSSGFSSA